MKTVKLLMYCNIIALIINGLIVWLTIIKAFPAALAFIIIFAFIGAATWLSCYAQGVLPHQRRKHDLHSSPTEQMERV